LSLSTAASHLVRHLLASLLYPDDILQATGGPPACPDTVVWGVLTGNASIFHPIHRSGTPGISSHVKLFSAVIIDCMTFAPWSLSTTALVEFVLAITDRYY
jgi:methyl coenzyme M reductase beta subunit